MAQAKAQVRCWLASDRGLVRRTNEDACAASTSGDDLQPARWEGLISSDGGWALLADGMGGHSAGEVASHLAVACLKSLSGLLIDEEGIRSAVEATSDALFDVMSDDDSLEGMGTTIAGVVFVGAEAIIFNVGDSRIYLLSEKIHLLSEDHVIGGNVLTQCLGGLDANTLPSPWIARTQVLPSDLLVICSDGLTDMVNDGEIERVLRGAPHNPAESLVDAALRAGGVDNVTVAVLKLAATQDH